MAACPAGGKVRRYLFAILIGLGGASVLAGLGMWQLQRLEWKESVLAEIAERMAGEPVDLPISPRIEEHGYSPVRVRGEVEARELHVLVSQRAEGAGFRVVSALSTDGGRRVLVDLGFIGDHAKDAPRPRAGRTVVTGNLHWPEDRDGFTPPNDPAANFWFARDLADMAATLETEPVLVVARRIDPPIEGIAPLPVGPEGIPNNHLGYAIQWFGMAAVWLGMTALLIRRISRPRKERAGAA